MNSLQDGQRNTPGVVLAILRPQFRASECSLESQQARCRKNPSNARHLQSLQMPASKLPSVDLLVSDFICLPHDKVNFIAFEHLLPIPEFGSRVFRVNGSGLESQGQQKAAFGLFD